MNRGKKPSRFAIKWLLSIPVWMILGGLGRGVWLPAAETPPLEGRTNLASGRPVVFSPRPNYGLTQKGDSDATDLTDGRTTRREDRRIWFDSEAVGWSYGGRVNLAIDLGQACRIDEIAIRLQGGSPQAGVSLPGWIEAFVSRDGQHFVKVADCSRWRDGDFARHGVPDEQGEAWIHCLRLEDLAAFGRWVGLRMYTGGLSVSDELYVFGSPGEDDRSGPPGDNAGDFTVAHPQPYFHKPWLVVATNLPAPIPVGLVVPEGLGGPADFEITLELPSGLELAAGRLGITEADPATGERTPEGGRRYRFSASARTSTKVLGRLYLQASGWGDGQSETLRCRFAHDGWESATCELPVRAVQVPAAGRLKRIMAGLGWWSAGDTAEWPNALDAWENLGLNGFPLFAHWMKEGDPSWQLADEARRRGFFIVNIDSPLHRLLERRRGEAEIYDQFDDGSVGTKLCLSYRGQFYQEEVQRFAKAMGRARPHFASSDVELWGWQGPLDCRKCTRCREDFEASGLKNWDEWQVAQGDEIWRDLITAARAEVEKAGGPPFQIGGYDFRPGAAYQNVWSVDRLYPDFMGDSQVSTYSCLYPYHLGLIGDEVRADRAKLGRSDVMPWITPGDAGTFPGESFTWALLECYTNGARGVYFWSGRVWDAESLIAYNRVIRAIGPVEDVIVEGQLVGDAATVEGIGRVSGIRRGDQTVLLVADYLRRGPGTVDLQLTLAVRSEMVDLFTGQTVTPKIPPGTQKVQVPLEGARARLLHVRPVQR
jgi:hypothetical protein